MDRTLGCRWMGRSGFAVTSDLYTTFPCHRSHPHIFLKSCCPLHTPKMSTGLDITEICSMDVNIQGLAAVIIIILHYKHLLYYGEYLLATVFFKYFRNVNTLEMYLLVKAFSNFENNVILALIALRNDVMVNSGCLV